METGKKQRLSPIDSGFRLQAEALDLLLRNDAAGSRAGPWTRGGYLELGSECKLLIGSFGFRSFYGSSEPGTTSHVRCNPVESVAPPFIFILPSEQRLITIGTSVKHDATQVPGLTAGAGCERREGFSAPSARAGWTLTSETDRG